MADYTLIQSGDPDAAENVGALAGDVDRGGIVSGLALSNYDSGAPSIDVAGGKTVHILDTATAEWTLNNGDQESAQRDKVQVVVGLDAQTVGLDAGALNELYVDPNWDTTDSPVITASTTGAPTPEAEKIGEVDTTNDTVSERWGVIEEDGTLSYPDNAAANAALSSLPDGVVVIDRTNRVRMANGGISVPTLEAGSEFIADGLNQSEDATNPKEMFWFDGPYFSPLFRTVEIDVVADNTSTKLTSFRGVRHNGLMVVMGSPGDSGNDGFSDVVNFAQSSARTVIDGTSRGSVGPRSYSNGSRSIYIAIDDNSTSYSVSVMLLGAGV